MAAKKKATKKRVVKRKVAPKRKKVVKRKKAAPKRKKAVKRKKAAPKRTVRPINCSLEMPENLRACEALLQIQGL